MKYESNKIIHVKDESTGNVIPIYLKDLVEAIEYDPDKDGGSADGAGLTGSATQLTTITDPSTATSEDIATKVNEIINQLVARGISTT